MFLSYLDISFSFMSACWLYCSNAHTGSRRYCSNEQMTLNNSDLDTDKPDEPDDQILNSNRNTRLLLQQLQATQSATPMKLSNLVLCVKTQSARVITQFVFLMSLPNLCSMTLPNLHPLFCYTASSVLTLPNLHSVSLPNLHPPPCRLIITTSCRSRICISSLCKRGKMQT